MSRVVIVLARSHCAKCGAAHQDCQRLGCGCTFCPRCDRICQNSPNHLSVRDEAYRRAARVSVRGQEP